MKKSLFLLSALAVAMTACTSDEVIEQAPTTTIGFNSFVNKSTRGTDLEAANFTSFDVWGVTTDPTNLETGLTSVFVKQAVTRNTTDNTCTYSPLRYWVVGNAYRFSALAPSNATGVTVQQDLTPTNPSTSQGGLNITFNNQTAGANVDLCYAFKTVASATATQPAVELTFGHMLSRVKFTFKNTFVAKNSVILVENVKITNAIASAKINKVNGENTWSEPTGTFEIPFATQTENNTTLIENTFYVPGLDGKTVANAAYVDTEHFYLIPLTAPSVYEVSFTVSLYNFNKLANGGKGDYELVRSYDHAVDLPSINYLNNYSYNFIAEINEKTIDPDNVLRPIEFTATISDWADFTNEPGTEGQGGILAKPETETPTPAE